MEKDLTLLVLAGGMGSRFGGLKQIEPVGPNGEFIIDYSIYDAIKAGFTKVVFLIKEENFAVFKETIGKRVEDKIKVEYVFQKNDDVPSGINIPETRVKPLGTAHAIYATRNIIHENFATINADDFYGKDAYIKAAEFLKNCNDFEYANIAYEAGNTLTLNGAVKRGVIFENNSYLEKIIESSIEQEKDKVIAKPLANDSEFIIDLNHPVSMNLFCFTPKIIEYISNNISKFFSNPEIDLEKEEYLLPDVVTESMERENVKVKIIKTDSKWYGMTYKEDLDILKNGILEEIESGKYNSNLWS